MSDMSSPTPTDPTIGLTRDSWRSWRAATPARVALGRAGEGLPTDELLRFGWAHAMARDAIHMPLDTEELATRLQERGWEVAVARSAATDRMAYLRRPDLGRRLESASADALRERLVGQSFDVCFVIGDGLSSLAVARHAVPLLEEVRARLPATLRIAPVVVATQARVALSDEIGEICRTQIAAILIGERPGLSSPDSLGVYLTYDPHRGRHDAQRNCISNVRPEGLGYDIAAHKLAWLMGEALRRGLTGVELKDESDRAALDRGATMLLDAASSPRVADTRKNRPDD